MQQIEHQEHQLAFVRRARAHLRHKAVEMRCPARIDQAEFAVENCRLRGQLAEGLHHAGQPGRGFRAALGVHADAGAILDDLEAKAVPLGFMNPIVALWWANGCGGGQGTDEGDTNGHVPYGHLEK
jgi:hypothetical protein